MAGDDDIPVTRKELIRVVIATRSASIAAMKAALSLHVGDMQALQLAMQNFQVADKKLDDMLVGFGFPREEDDEG